MKKCAKCKELKSFDNFKKASNRSDGLYNYCRPCAAENDKEYRIRNADKIKQNRINNRDKRSKQWAIWYSNNLEYAKKKKLEYYYSNRDKMLENTKKSHRERLINDPLFKFRHRLSGVIRQSFKRCLNGKFKKSQRSEDILGCKLSEFINHIESLFVDGMSFENYGKWHIDHIIPLSSAKTEEDIIRLNHYTNLQPLWAIDNIKKGSKNIQGSSKEKELHN